MVVGVGGGTSEAGQFLGPDVGVILALQNDHLVPFINFSGFLSQPINAKEIDLSFGDEPLGTRLQAPKVTYGATWAFGLRLPIPVTDGIILSPHFGLGGTLLYDEDNHSRIQGLMAGLDVTF